MFEKYINRIYQTNVEKLGSLGERTTLKELKNTDLHPAFINYLSAELDYLIYKDRSKILNESQFDYTDCRPGVSDQTFPSLGLQ